MQAVKWAVSYREINQHPSLPWNSITHGLSGTGDSQRDSRESIRANHSQLKPLF